MAANNYAEALRNLRRFKEANVLLSKLIPAARRVFGNSHELTLMMRANHGRMLYLDTAATLDDLREAVRTLEETERTARRVMGSANPVTMQIEQSLQSARAAARAALRARESPPDELDEVEDAD